jgi:hypothetical protein
LEVGGRWHTGEISAKSDPFTKHDAPTIEFNVPVKPGEERKLSFTGLYTQLPARNDSQQRSDADESEMLST